MTASDVLVESLIDWGVEVVFGLPGDGQARAKLLPVMFGSELIQAFREFKSAWDPEWRMNPGKIVDPYPLDTNLREGPDYRPKPVLTVFKFPADHGSLAEATERCFGVGKCRGLDGGTMCPSFHATREEMHSTRGRTRMLFEMLRGEVIQDGWHDEHIKEALDLCLSTELQVAESSGYQILIVQDLSEDYQLTLHHWIERLQCYAEPLAEIANREFRSWLFYLLDSAAKLDVGDVQFEQILLRRAPEL